ncbi:hypothetical protein EV363DRAFT_1299078 [Boletus edulis]|nr:hypothetical protein EV363DRAFT_1299078 [Boletus edulis]
MSSAVASAMVWWCRTTTVVVTLGAVVAVSLCGRRWQWLGRRHCRYDSGGGHAVSLSSLLAWWWRPSHCHCGRRWRWFGGRCSTTSSSSSLWWCWPCHVVVIVGVAVAAVLLRGRRQRWWWCWPCHVVVVIGVVVAAVSLCGCCRRWFGGRCATTSLLLLLLWWWCWLCRVVVVVGVVVAAVSLCGCRRRWFGGRCATTSSSSSLWWWCWPCRVVVGGGGDGLMVVAPRRCRRIVAVGVEMAVPLSHGRRHRGGSGATVSSTTMWRYRRWGWGGRATK